MGQKEECWEGNLGSGNVVMEHRQGGREENKELGMRLWNIGRNAERSAGKGECGYMSKEGHRQGTKFLGTVRAINDVGK